MVKENLYLFQLDELREERAYINKYDGSIISLLELNKYWKEFAFDLISKLEDKSVLPKDNLLTFIKNNYIIIIEKEKIDIDFNDYVELNDYLTFEEWLKLGNNYTLI